MQKYVNLVDLVNSLATLTRLNFQFSVLVSEYIWYIFLHIPFFSISFSNRIPIPKSIDLQKSASIQPGKSPLKFGGDPTHFFIRLLRCDAKDVVLVAVLDRLHQLPDAVPDRRGVQPVRIHLVVSALLISADVCNTHKQW